jgi:hypothetical protein
MYKGLPTSDVFSSSFAQFSSYVVLDSAWCLFFCLQQANPSHFQNLSLFLLFPTLSPSLFFRQRRIIQFTYLTNMHRQKTVAQILLILSILNSVLAAPTVIRGMPGAHDTVAVRGPGGGVVGTSTGSTPEPQPNEGFDWESWMKGHPRDPYKDFNWESWSKGVTSTQPTSTGSSPQAGHSETQSVASSKEIPQPETQSVASSKGIPQPETQSVASSKGIPQPEPQPQSAAPSKAAWKQKMLTPEKIKATKYVGAAGLLLVASMGFLLPDIIHNDYKDSQS